MNNTYILKKKKIVDLVEEIDSFKTRIDIFNNKYNNRYSYGIDIYSEEDEESKGSLYIAKLNIKTNE